MSILKVVEWPAKVLETPAETVTKFDDSLRAFVNDMFETMFASKGIGLAANQVGDLRRVITIEIPYAKEDAESEATKMWWHDKRFTFINPIIVKKSGRISWQEGCLSFPEVYDFVDRSAEVWIKAQDEFGKDFEVHATDLFAVCLQHEIDHIDGVVFFKRMSRLKAERVRNKMLKRGKLDVDEKNV
ncbi:MAG: peptide deformylase [Proteobacteria bacterium]|nr:peptide deformylase [Pseudomonadota bacterium]